jgi:hypothetical protein
MSVHPQVALRSPFSGYDVDIDMALVPVIERLWALGIETTGSCHAAGMADASAWRAALNLDVQFPRPTQRRVVAVPASQRPARTRPRAGRKRRCRS